jgi:ParB/RepB/Spo0J family partition protein
MTKATPSTTDVRHVALDDIHVGENVRDLDCDHVDSLAQSIALRGLLVPLIVRPVEGGYELVGGNHRLAACRQLGHKDVQVVVRDHDGSSADSAAENVTRKQLTPLEEARAVNAMLDEGYTHDGAAQALGWSRQLVTQRAKILELPERAQEMIGARSIALSAVEQLRAIGNVSPPLLDAMIAFLDANEWAAERLTREPGWVLDSALREGNSKAFAAYLHSAEANTITALKLGKKTDQLYAQAEQLHRQTDRYAYGPPQVRFSDSDVDQARAAGVLIEFDHGRPIIVDRALYRELVKAAIKRTVQELEAKVAAAATETKAQRTAKTPTDPRQQAERERNRQLRELADQAHGANLDLGSQLLNNLATVDPNSMTVARFFVYALLGEDYERSPYTQSGEHIHRIAIGGIRLCVEQLRTDVTKKRKDGTPGRLRIDYGTEPDAALKWLWRFVDAAKTPGELYGRALVVIAAQQHASRLVLPTSKRGHPIGWASHNDHAAKALNKLAGPHLPATLRKLEQAVTRAHNDYDKAITAQRAATAEPPDPDDQAADAQEHNDNDGDSAADAEPQPDPTEIGG